MSSLASGMPTDVAGQSPPISLEHVSFRYPGGAPVLEDVTLHVDHPAYRKSAVIVGDTRQSLARDLELKA